MDQPDAKISPFLDDLAGFISASPSPFHASALGTELLLNAGFTVVHRDDAWPSAPGRYVLADGGALVAWSTADGASVAHGFRILGAHTDSPNLRIRPQPDHSSVGMGQIGVEIYGGVLLNSWLDRDLGLSGRVSIRTSRGTAQSVLLQVDEPLLRVPQLAIHLDRSISAEGLRLDPQRHMQPIWSAAADTAPRFRSWLADRLSVSPSSIEAWDFMAHDLTPPALIGVDQSMFAASRIDNLLSCHASLRALLESLDHPSLSVPVVCLFDHEEVGSQSATGAAGPLLEITLERIALSAGLDREQWFAALARSRCISADGAHATHPNWPERHEPDHLVQIDGGPVIKWNANARYATDSPVAASVIALAQSLDIPLQVFVSRNDIACGSTIGPVTATRLGIATVDIGVAQLSMHSAREVTGVADPARFAALLSAFLTDDSPLG
ncbi:MAG: M18 family aminopeptidase [Acidimicrobiales bacterium]